MSAARAVVFCGPTVSADEVAAAVPGAVALPPVARGDLARAREAGADVMLVLDGSFAHGLAVSPREVVDVARDGARVLGASSMGALRAAECWPAGVEGVGAVYRMYRMGLADSDDEVAVVTDPDRGHRALSVALVNVRCAASRAARRGVLSRDEARALVEGARAAHFSERRWRPLLGALPARVDRDALADVIAASDLKRADAVRALARLRALLDAGEAPRPRGDVPLAPAVRYVGHDPLTGRDPAAAPAELVAWLFGSGRYQRHVWALLAGDDALRGLRAGALREALPGVLRRRLDDPGFAARVWEELAFLDELEPELMRWHAAESLAARAEGEPPPALAARVREELAVAHGLRDQAALRREVAEGRLFGAIPFAWVERAADQIARARFAAGSL